MSNSIDEITRAVRRDIAVRARILAIAPWIFGAMDAQEMGESAASGRELAQKMLKALGIEYDPNDNFERLASAWLSGATWGATSANMNGAYTGPTRQSYAQDGAESSFIDRYLKQAE